jgi:hypothetical protein
MKNLNGEETLWVILPILLVVGLLVASIIILPKTQVQVTSKASQPTAVPTKIILPTAAPSISERPEIVCSSLYSPVCSLNGVTYANECEANQAGVTAFTKGTCPKTKATPTPVTLPITL